MAAKLKRPITLLETLVVIALIGLTTSLLSMRGYRALQNYRYESSIQAILSKLSLAQELMLAHETDVTLHLTPTQLTLTTPTLTQTTSLSNITDLTFDSPLLLPFSAQHRHLFPHGNIQITGSAGQQTTVGLPGYPTQPKLHPIERITHATPPTPEIA